MLDKPHLGEGVGTSLERLQSIGAERVEGQHLGIERVCQVNSTLCSALAQQDLVQRQLEIDAAPLLT